MPPIFFEGHGFVVVFLFFMSGFAGLLFGWDMESPNTFAAVTLLNAFLVQCYCIWLKRKRAREQSTAEVESSQEASTEEADTLLFIPLRFWPYILVAIAIFKSGDS